MLNQMPLSILSSQHPRTYTDTDAYAGISVDAIQAACQRIEDAGYKFQKKLTDGRMRSIAFALDPDGYVSHYSKQSLPIQITILRSMSANTPQVTGAATRVSIRCKEISLISPGLWKRHY